MLINSQIRKEGGDVLLAHIEGMALTMEKDKTPDPLHIRRLCAQAVVPYPQCVPDPVEQTRFFHDHLPVWIYIS